MVQRLKGMKHKEARKLGEITSISFHERNPVIERNLLTYMGKGKKGGVSDSLD